MQEENRKLINQCSFLRKAAPATPTSINELNLKATLNIAKADTETSQVKT
jgi:hypothetical protein